MKIYRYWHSVEREIGGTKVRSRAGSNESPAQAALLAEQKFELYRRFADPALTPPSPEELAAFRKKSTGSSEYEVPICEEVVEELDKHNVVTRNRYGALVLNSEDHAFLDIDFCNCPPPSFGERLRAFFGGAPLRAPEERLFELLRQVVNDRLPFTPVRLYRTSKGFRMLLKNDRPAESPAMQELMKQLFCDNLYASLCARQKCYRARLTPKPRRIGMKNTALKFSFPYDETQNEERRAWLEAYERRSAKYAVCRLVKGFGPEMNTPVTAYHDRVCGVGSDRPLA